MGILGGTDFLASVLNQFCEVLRPKTEDADQWLPLIRSLLLDRLYIFGHWHLYDDKDWSAIFNSARHNVTSTSFENVLPTVRSTSSKILLTEIEVRANVFLDPNVHIIAEKIFKGNLRDNTDFYNSLFFTLLEQRILVYLVEEMSRRLSNDFVKQRMVELAFLDSLQAFQDLRKHFFKNTIQLPESAREDPINEALRRCVEKLQNIPISKLDEELSKTSTVIRNDAIDEWRTWYKPGSNRRRYPPGGFVYSDDPNSPDSRSLQTQPLQGASRGDDDTYLELVEDIRNSLGAAAGRVAEVYFEIQDEQRLLKGEEKFSKVKEQQVAQKMDISYKTVGRAIKKIENFLGERGFRVRKMEKTD